jgi:thioredoxin 1
METSTVKRSFSETIAASPLVLVDFFTEWCGPCKMMAPVLKELKQTMQDGITILKVDVDKNNQTAAFYKVSGVPTLILFKKGVQVWRQSGAMPLHTLKNIIEQNR